MKYGSEGNLRVNNEQLKSVINKEKLKIDGHLKKINY